MRVVLDTNILVSSLLSRLGYPASIYIAWFADRFTLVTCEEQIGELRVALRKLAVAGRIKPYMAGRLINDMREYGEIIDTLPRIERSPDPTDDFLLALSEAGKADYLVTGDKKGLLSLAIHKGTRIVSARKFAASFEKFTRAGGGT